MNKNKLLWITKTAIFIALLVVLQWVTKPLSTYVTGSAVNFILIASVLLAGLSSGITVALLSPFFAFLVGIGPAFPAFLPVIALGNAAIVLVWHFVASKGGYVKYVIALVSGAALKFAVLYLGIVKILIPTLSLPEAKAAVLSASFSYPQLITVAIGGVIAIAAVPLIRRAIKN